MATSGRVNTNTIYTGTTYWYIETYWRVTGWGTGDKANLANIEWKAYLRRSSGSKTQVQSYNVGGNVNGDVHSWRIQSGTMYKDQELGSGTLQQWGSNPVRVVTSGHIYGSGSSHYVSADQTWTLDNNITTPSCSCTITSVSENSISASLTVTNSGNASITYNELQISANKNFSSAQTVNGTTATWKNLSLNTQYYVRARVKNAGNIYSSYSTPTTQPHTWNKPTIKSVAVANLIAGNSQTITLNNDHSRNCTIKVLKGSTVLYSGTTSGTTLTFTIPVDKCRTALGTGSDPTTEVSIQYSCVYSSWDDTTAANAYKLKNNTTYKPTWNSNFDINAAITYRHTDSVTTRITDDPQILVQGKSEWAYTLKLTGNQAAIKNSNSESDIKKYQVSTYNGTTWTGFTDIEATATNVSMGKVDSKATSVGIRIQAIDCKGVISDIKTKTISVIPYNVPSGTISANRKNNYGETIQLKINPSWAIVSKNNEERAEISYKLSTAPESDYTVLDNNVKNFNTFITLSPSFNNSSGYNFKVKLYDAFGGESAEIKALVGPGMPIFFIDETVNGVGVNDIPTEQGLFVDGKTNIKGDLKVTNTINNTFNISVGNKNNYPYHRIAYTPVRTGNYIDNSIVLLLTAGYQGGPYGIVKCDLRTNNASGGGTAGASAIWLSRYGFSADQVVLGLKNTAADSYLDIFVKTSGTYNSIVATPLYMGRRGTFDTSMYTLCNSKEVDNTTTTDSLTSYESYSIISATASANKGPRTYTNVITAADGGNVNFSNNIQVDTTNPSDPTIYYPTFVTGSGSQRERINNGLLYYSKEGTASVQGEAHFRIGNGTSSGKAGNKKGYLQLYGQNTGDSRIEYTDSTSSVTQILPALAGTFVVKQKNAIGRETNGWYKVNMGAFTLYFKHGTINNYSFSANSWGWFSALNLPSGVTFDPAKMVATANAIASDAAIICNIATSENGTQFSFNWQNRWSDRVTTNVRYDLSLIVFP